MYEKQNKRNEWKWVLNTAGFFTTTTLGRTRRPPPTRFSGSTANLQPRPVPNRFFLLLVEINLKCRRM